MFPISTNLHERLVLVADKDVSDDIDGDQISRDQRSNLLGRLVSLIDQLFVSLRVDRKFLELGLTMDGRGRGTGLSMEYILKVKMDD